MQGDPYTAMAALMRSSAREAAPEMSRIGTVVRETPLAVDVGGAVQEYPGDLAYLLPSPFVEVEVDGTALRYDTLGDAGHNHTGATESHTHSARLTGGLPRFRAGEKLLLIPIEEEQRYIVLGRLVGL